MILYVAGALALAWWLPHRPSMTLPSANYYQFLVGFSPDGTRLAVAPRFEGDRMSSSKVEARRADPYWIWDTKEKTSEQFVWEGSFQLGESNFLPLCRTTRSAIWWHFLDDPKWCRRLESDNDAERDERRKASVSHPDSRPRPSNRDRLLLALSSGNGGIDLIDWEPYRRLVELPHRPTTIAYSPRDDSIIAACPKIMTRGAHPRYCVERWSLQTGRKIAESYWEDLDQTIEDALYPLSRIMTVSPEGRWVVDSRSNEYDPKSVNGLYVRDSVTCFERFFVPGPKSFAFANSDRILITKHDFNGELWLRLVDLETGESRALTTNRGYSQTVFEPESMGSLFAAAVYCYRPSPLAHLPKLNNWLNSLGIDLSASRSDVLVFDAVGGNQIACLPNGPYVHSSQYWEDVVPQLAFSPDGKFLAVLSDDGIRIWDLPARRSWGLILMLPMLIAAPIAFVAFRRRKRLRSTELPTT